MGMLSLRSAYHITVNRPKCMNVSNFLLPAQSGLTRVHLKISNGKSNGSCVIALDL